MEVLLMNLVMFLITVCIHCKLDWNIFQKTLKMEKVKEEIQMDNKTFSEIAYDLNYKSSSHLAKQFKTVTGMSMSEYKNVQDWNRKSLDQIV